MPKIPLTTPGGPSLSIDFPRPVPKAAMIANLGAEALSASANLQRMLTDDRNRRDYNEQLIAAQDAVNLRLNEAAESNDPRTMLQRFNTDITNDLSSIRAKIKSRKFKSDFDLRVNSGLNVSRSKILKDQLSLERQESKIQLFTAGEKITESVRLDSSFANLTLARDKIKDLTDHAVETHALTKLEAKMMNKGLLKDIETLARQSLVKNDRHMEAITRLEAGEFRSVHPTDIPGEVAAIRKDMQNGNFHDLWFQIEDGNASHELGTKIRAMGESKDLSESQARKLWDKNNRVVNALVTDRSGFQRIQNYLDRLDGATLGPDDQKALDKFAAQVLDPNIMSKRLEFEEAGGTWTPQKTIEMRAAYIERLNWMMPKGWGDQAVAGVMSLANNPAEGIANARLLDMANKGRGGVYQAIGAGNERAGQRAQRINKLRAHGFSDKELVDRIMAEELAMTSGDKQETAARFQKLKADDPLFYREGFAGELNDLNEHMMSNGTSIGDYIQEIGFREGRTGRPTGFKQEPGEALAERNILNFGRSSIATALFPIKKEISALEELVDKDAMPPGFAEVDGQTLFSQDTTGFMNKLYNFGEGDVSSIIIPPEMEAAYLDLLQSEFELNGGVMEAASQWAMDKILQTWHPTQYEGQPRWTRGAIEQYHEPVNGNWDWAPAQVARHMNEELLTELRAYEVALGAKSQEQFLASMSPEDTASFQGLPEDERAAILETEGAKGQLGIPKWEEGMDYGEFRDEVWKVLAWVAQDDPNASIRFEEFPQNALDEGREWRNKMEEANVLQNFPWIFGLGKHQVTSDAPMQTISFTTQESLERINPETGRQSPGRYVQYLGRDGAYHSVYDLVGGKAQQEFQYDVREVAEWQAQQRREKIRYINIILANHAMLGLSKEQSVAKLAELATSDPRLRGAEDFILKNRFVLHDPSTGVFDQRGPVGMQSPTGSRGGFLSTGPQFDREAFLEQQREETQARILEP